MNREETGRWDAAEQDGEGYAVGNCRPPVEHRFPKGQSGNPAGRPRATGAPGDRLRGSDEPTRGMILDEAYRMVPVDVDGKIVEMRMGQAVMRSLATAALNGNPTAMRRWTELVRQAEADQKMAQVAIYSVFERDAQQKEISARKGERGDITEFYADDILFDPKTGRVVVRGEDG
ncbi:DUF5681 domain-containing protein [Sphingomonas sp.]|uniref:DUF5681 domain-containing protein n=1 Tax=Sphingomonas sp. TaxID=28214 RepID=UPI003D6CAD4F